MQFKYNFALERFLNTTVNFLAANPGLFGVIFISLLIALAGIVWVKKYNFTEPQRDSAVLTFTEDRRTDAVVLSVITLLFAIIFGYIFITTSQLFSLCVSLLLFPGSVAILRFVYFKRTVMLNKMSQQGQVVIRGLLPERKFTFALADVQMVVDKSYTIPFPFGRYDTGEENHLSWTQIVLSHQPAITFNVQFDFIDETGKTVADFVGCTLEQYRNRKRLTYSPAALPMTGIRQN